MIDIAKHIEYWKKSSEEDFSAAKVLLENGHLRHSFFFARLAIEKILKGLVTKKTSDITPRLHNLIGLAGIAEIKLSSKKEQFLREFGVHQLDGLYPDFEQAPISLEYAKEEIEKAEKIFQWLKKTL
jgi:HEPN domain-containing protein